MADIDKINDLLSQIQDLAPSGFAIGFHIRLTSPEFMFQTYPKGWLDVYAQKGFLMVDPTVRWGFSETGAIRWSEMEHLDDVGVLKQSAAYGMIYGLAIANETGESRSIAGFSRPDREYTDQEIAVLVDLVQKVHDQTASQTGMSTELQAELRALSVKMTRPTATND